MEKIIILDFDGVMNPKLYKHYLRDRYKASNGVIKSKDLHGYFFDPYCVRNLAFIVEKTGADIVVCSSWRLHVHLQEMWDDRKLPGKVIGGTPSLATQTNAARKSDNAFHLRWQEVDMWLSNEQYKGQYVILDDHPEIFRPHQYEFLVQCESNIGLTGYGAAQAVRILS